MKPTDHRAVMASRQPTASDDPDFFPTEPWGARAGAELVRRLDPVARTVWEPACGAGHMVHALKDYFPTVWASDAYAYDGNAIVDFLAEPGPDVAADWIVSNPPFGDGRAEAFVRKAHARARRGVALLMRAAVLKKGRWDPEGSSAAFYAWFIWMKPVLRPQRFMARICGELRPGVEPIPPGTRERLTRPDDAALFGAVDRSRGAG